MQPITFVILLMVIFAPAAVASSLAAVQVPDAQCVSSEPPTMLLSMLLPLGGLLLLCARATCSAHWISISFVLWTALTAVMIACALGIAVLTAWSGTVQSWVLVASTALPHAL